MLSPFDDSKGHRQSYHFSFLRDFRVPGFYISEFDACFLKYPFLREKHRFDFYSFIFFTDGKGSFESDDMIFEIKKGRLFFCPENTVHAFHFSETPKGFYTFFCRDFYSVEFSMIRLMYLFSFCLPIAGRPPVRYIDTDKGDKVALLFDILWEECSKTPVQPSTSNLALVLRSYLNILILKISAILGDPGNLMNSGMNNEIIQLSHLIEANYAIHSKGGFYAKSLGVSESKLNLLCKSNLGAGIKKIILDRRIMEARRLLEQTGMSVAEIAYKLDFSDNSYFTKVFKSLTRLTPGRYRELHRKVPAGKFGGS